MVTTVRATIREEDGHQVIVLPEGVRPASQEVIVRQDDATGDLTISISHDHTAALREFFAFVRDNPVPIEEWDEFDRAWRDGRNNDLPEDDDDVVRLLLDEA